MLRPILRVVHHRWLLTGPVGSLFLDSMGGGAWPFLFGEVISLVNYFDDRALSLLNSVQHVSYWITSFKDVVCVTQSRL